MYKSEKRLRKRVSRLNKNKKNIYFFQSFLLLVNFFCFIKNISLLNELAFTLYAVPVVIDLVYEYFDVTMYKIIKFIILFINIPIVLIMLALYLSGLTEDAITCFKIIDSASYFAGTIIVNKGFLLTVMFIDIFIPIMLRFSLIDEKDLLMEKVIGNS